MLALNSLQPGGNKVKTRKRVGRGNGSGFGKTCGRGQKGAGARKSAKKGRVAFEGGQMPLQMRLPKRGFKSRNPKVIQIVNLKDLNKVEAEVIDSAALKASGLIKTDKIPVKILGFGELEKAVNLKVNEISESAKTLVESKGGKVEIV